MTRPSYTCSLCQRTSYHPKDIEHRYCGACNQYQSWNREEILKAIEKGTPKEKRERLKRAGILNEEGQLSSLYQPKGEEE